MIGAIIGDMAGSRFEHHPHREGIDPLDFPLFSAASRFTDDTVMSIAVSQALMDAGGDPDKMREACALRFKEFGRRYPRAGYGGRFKKWLASEDLSPLGSFGNGSAMRVSPVGWSCGSLEETERMARASAEATHNHPEGVKGACSVACAIFLARQGQSQKEIRRHLQRTYGYELGLIFQRLVGFNHHSCNGGYQVAGSFDTFYGTKILTCRHLIVYVWHVNIDHVAQCVLCIVANANVTKVALNTYILM